MASLGSSPPITRLSHLSTDTDTVLNHYMHYHKSEHTAERKENPREMVQSYYELATDFYEYGYGKSFHFCPVYDGKTLAENIVDYEIGIAESLGAKAGMKLLVIICIVINQTYTCNTCRYYMYNVFISTHYTCTCIYNVFLTIL